MRSPARALLLVLALLPAGCPAPPAATVERPNVLVIAIDTLRADKLGCYGGTLGLSPHVDALAAEGVRFEHAFAHAPWTLPSFASLFSSTYPEQHGAGGNVGQGFRTLSAEFETFPGRLRDQGWTTHAIVNVDFLGSKFGVTRGFETVDAFAPADNTRVRDATATTDAALAWLDRRGDAPFALFVHYFDPHAEYAPPEPWRARFAGEQDRVPGAFEFGSRAQIVRHRSGAARLNEPAIRRAERLYDGEIAYTDSEVGRLLEGLAARGLDPTTLVVLTSDHGEEFLDHGDYEHGHTLYDELIRVPLIFRQKGRLAPRTVAQPVAHVDVAPTILALAGVARAPGFVGHDLAPVFDGRAPPATALIAYGSFWGEPLSSLRDGERKLIRSPTPTPGVPRVELYDWVADPRERHDLAAGEQERARALGLDLDLFSRTFAAHRPGAAPRPDLTEQEHKRLDQLGYTGGDGAGGAGGADAEKR